MQLRILALVAGLCALHCAAASAEDASRVPDGYVQAFKTGRVTVYATSKTALSPEQKNDIQLALRSLLDRYTAQYGLDREIYKPGTLKTLVEPRDTVDLVLFPDLQKFEEWCGAPGVGGLTAHVGRHENVVGVPLENGDISAHFWWVLAHEFSHVFFAHALRLCGPIWLNEGLAEYFASTSKLYVATEHENFRKMLERLDGYRKTERGNLVSVLIRKSQAEFGRQEYDEAWLLTHLLLTEFPSLLNDLVTATRGFEQDGYADLNAVLSDVRKYSAGLLEQAFGGADQLQAAFNAHLAEMIRNPAAPAKQAVKARGIVAAPVGPDIEMKIVASEKLVEDEDGKIYKARSSSGTLRYRAPWTATVRILIAVGDDKGNWSEDYLLRHAGTMKAGDKEVWDDELLPKFKGARLARITAEWKLESGGTYRTCKVFRDR